MQIFDIFSNQVLIAAMLAWVLAQALKVPIEYLSTHEWNWSLLLQSGGMPSSHSAIVVSLAHATGQYSGFDSIAFAITFVFCMIVIYDATGIRRQAGIHASIINKMILDLATGHPLKQEQLREVLGHSPIEAFAGVVLGLVTAQIVWMVWH